MADVIMARYVRPIYEAIDNRQYRPAIKLCEHKRVAHLDIVRVLKAHCLERIGRATEALDICRAVQRTKPLDDTLLNTMHLVFKLAGCEHEMLPTYEYACAHQDPPNDELYQSLFFAYVKRGDFLKQQQTALKMYKAFGTLKYMCWATMSMMLQVQHGTTPPKMLALAERMLVKTLRELKSDDGEALQLALLIMKLQDKHTDAVQLFDELVPAVSAADATDGKKTKKTRAAEGKGAYEEDIELGPMQAIDRLTLEATLAKRILDWKRCVNVNKELLEKYNADDWKFLLEFIGARFQQAGDDFQPLDEELTTFLTELQKKPGNERMRGPALAIIHVKSEILKRLLEHKKAEMLVHKAEEQLVDQIEVYMKRFYTKTCCFSDLKQYLSLFLGENETTSATSKAQLIQRVHKLLDEAPLDAAANSDEDRKKALNALNQRLLTRKTLRFLGFYIGFTQAELASLVDSLVQEYESSSWLNMGSTGGQREVQYTDDLLLLASHFLLDMYQQDSKYGGREHALLLRAASLLEYGLENSVYNFQMKLMLTRVYAHLAASKAMLERHVELDVKQIQLDSLSYLVLDKLVNLCDYDAARRQCESIRYMHRNTARDTPDYITRAYRFGVYSKVVDMTGFLYQRMQNSHTLAIAKSELLLFGIQDAFATGPKLFDFLISDAFQGEIDDLDKVLSNKTKLSQNQHREVVVEWNAKPLIPTGHTFTPEGSALVECDRSADFSSSFVWLQLSTLVGKLLRSTALSHSEVLATHALAYEEYLSKLQLTVARHDKDHQQQLWQWSARVVSAVSKLMVDQESDSSSLSSELNNLAFQFSSVTELIATQDSLSAYGIATMSLLLHGCGFWSLGLLSTALRVKKNNKKDDRVTALRSALKQMQDALITLAAKVTTATSSLKTEVNAKDSDSASEALIAAQHKAQQNVIDSHRATQTQIARVLRDFASGLRLILQK